MTLDLNTAFPIMFYAVDVLCNNFGTHTDTVMRIGYVE